MTKVPTNSLFDSFDKAIPTFGELAIRKIIFITIFYYCTKIRDMNEIFVLDYYSPLKCIYFPNFYNFCSVFTKLTMHLIYSLCCKFLHKFCNLTILVTLSQMSFHCTSAYCTLYHNLILTVGSIKNATFYRHIDAPQKAVI